MSEAPTNPLPSWHDSAASNGFGVFCLHFPEGERFTFVIMDRAKVREHGFRKIETWLLVDELRGQLALIGFAKNTVEDGIRVARAWATSTTMSFARFIR